MKDFFRPITEPARTIYDAFCHESVNRKGKSIEEWTENERVAVFNAAYEWAKAKNLIPPTMEDVKYAESLAIGSADYGVKWAHKICDIIEKVNKVNIRTFSSCIHG